MAIVNMIQVLLFSENCQLCHKNRIENKDKKIEPSLMTTFDVDRNIKENARIKNASLYNEIKDLDLIATEFKYIMFHATETLLAILKI